MYCPLLCWSDQQEEARRRKAREAQARAEREQRLQSEREAEHRLQEELLAAQEAAMREEQQRLQAKQVRQRMGVAQWSWHNGHGTARCSDLDCWLLC